jgi:hypothetical protein
MNLDKWEQILEEILIHNHFKINFNDILLDLTNKFKLPQPKRNLINHEAEFKFVLTLILDTGEIISVEDYSNDEQEIQSI